MRMSQQNNILTEIKWQEQVNDILKKIKKLSKLFTAVGVNPVYVYGECPSPSEIID